MLQLERRWPHVWLGMDPQGRLARQSCPSGAWIANLHFARKEMKDNDNLISSLLSKPQYVPQRRLVLCFDRTNLQPTTRLCQTVRGQCLVGGPHICGGFIGLGESQLVMKDNEEKIARHTASWQRPKAKEVNSLLLWDPSGEHSCIYETAPLPCMAGAQKHQRFEDLSLDALHQRGQFETLCRIGMY